MKSVLLTVSLILSSISFALPPESILLHCGVLKDSKGSFSKSAPTITVVIRLVRGEYNQYVKSSSLAGTTYELLVSKGVTNNGNISESKSYSLFNQTRKGIITISTKGSPKFSAVCRDPNQG